MISSLHLGEPKFKVVDDFLNLLLTRGNPGNISVKGETCRLLSNWGSIMIEIVEFLDLFGGNWSLQPQEQFAISIVHGNESRGIENEGIVDLIYRDYGLPELA